MNNTINIKNIKAHGYNLALLQWRVVDGIERCGLKILAKRTRPTASDLSANASNAESCVP